jgi:hypothetical protein
LRRFLLENNDFLGAALIDDFADNFGVSHQWSANFYVAVVAEEQNIRESDCLTHFGVELFDLDDITFRDAVLFTAGSNYCLFHRIIPKRDF